MTTKLLQQQSVLPHSIVAVALMFCLTAFVGCGSNSGENVVFAQHQPARAGVERWEYKIVATNYRFITEHQEKLLNELGTEGWELVQIDTGTSDVTSWSHLYFKRRLP